MSSFSGKINQNIVIQIVGRLISLAIGILIIAFIARYLGPTYFGYFTTITAFLQIFAILMDFGLSLMTLQFLGQPDADQEKIINNFFTLRFFSGLIFIGLSSLIILFFPYPWLVKLGTVIFSLSFFFNLLLQIFTSYFQKLFQTIKSAIGEISGRLMVLIAIILVVKLDLGFFAVLFALILGALVNFLVILLFAQRLIKIKFSFDWPFWLKIFHLTWPVALSIAFHLVYFKADTLILSFYHPARTVGIYGAPYRILEILIMFPPMFLGLIQPLLAKSWADRNLPDLKNLVQKSFNFLSLITLPMVVGTLILADRLILLIAGPEFLESGLVLKIIILATGAIFLSSLFSNAAIAVNRQKIMLYFRAAIAVLALVGYFIFIPAYSYLAAAWITVIVELLVLLVMYLIVVKTTDLTINLKAFLKSLAASLIMGASLILLFNFNLLLLMTIAALIYFACLYLFGGFSLRPIKEMINF